MFGNNGADKTILTKIIFNKLKANSGAILLDKIAQENIDFKNWYFFVENNELPRSITVKTFIELNANVHHVKKAIIKETIDKFKPILDITKIKNT